VKEFQRRADLLFPFLLVLVLLAGAYLRVSGLYWGEYTYMHPDERFLTSVTNDSKIPGSIADYFNTGTSTLNPYNLQNNISFVYGTVPLFLGKIGSSLSGPLGFGDRASYGGLFSVGRTLSALFDIGTIVVIVTLETPGTARARSATCVKNWRVWSGV